MYKAGLKIQAGKDNKKGTSPTIRWTWDFFGFDLTIHDLEGRLRHPIVNSFVHMAARVQTIAQLQLCGAKTSFKRYKTFKSLAILGSHQAGWRLNK